MLELVALLGVPAAFVAFWAAEAAINALGGGRPFPKVRGWAVTGALFFVMAAGLTGFLPVLLPQAWLAEHRLLDLTGLGLWGAPVGFVAFSFVFYGFHRLVHRSDLMWRTMHQLHHSAERVDMAGWSVIHPLELSVVTAMGVVLNVFVLGLDPLAAALAVTATNVVNMIQHLNVPTPRWLGYIVLRPEQHCLHHERDVHARNYSGDLAIWDMLFGSFENPQRFDGQVGFGRAAIPAIPAMLAFADVSIRSDRQ